MKRVIKCFLIAITLLLLTACASNSTDKTINSISEVDGNNLGCMSGSIFDELIEEVFPNSEIIYFNSRSELLLGLTTGKIDGFIADEPVAMMMVKENEGVKFWKFNLRDDKADPYNQIIDLFKYRKKKSLEKGEEPENILDLYNGRDLIVTVKSTKESNSSVITIRLDEDITPITNDEELLKSWIYDKKTWQEVFPPKDYDYITLVSEGKYPWFDREENKWVDREVFNAKKNGKTQEETKKVEEADKKLREDSEPEKYTEKSSFEQTVSLDNDEDDGEELPF